jgi:hypothetical protein
MNVVSEAFAINGCFSGSTLLALSKYAIVFQCFGDENLNIVAAFAMKWVRSPLDTI